MYCPAMDAVTIVNEASTWWSALPAFGGGAVGGVLGALGTLAATRNRAKSEDEARRWSLKHEVYFQCLEQIEGYEFAMRNVIDAADLPQEGHGDFDGYFEGLIREFLGASRAVAPVRARCIVVGGVPVAKILDEILYLHAGHLPTSESEDRFRVLYESLLKEMNAEIGATKNPKTRAPEPMPAQFCGH